MKKIFLSLIWVLSSVSLFANTVGELNLLRYDDIEYLANLIMDSYLYEDQNGNTVLLQIPNASDFTLVESDDDDHDLVYMKNGSVLECHIISQDAENLVVRTLSGNEISIQLSKVEKIVTQFVDGDYNFTITSSYPNITEVAAPTPVPVAINKPNNGTSKSNDGEEITKAEDFNLSVFPYLTKVKGKDSPKEASKPKLARLDHYVGEGVDFDAVEFQKFIEQYCPDAARHFKKFRINTLAVSGVSLVFVIGTACNILGIIDMLVLCGVDFFLIGKMFYHMNRPLKVYNSEYANKPVAFDPNADGTLIPPVEQPVYTLVPAITGE